MALEPEKVVARGDLPARRLGRERPVREIIRIGCKRIKRDLDRPRLAEAIAGALEQLVIGFGAPRIVTLDIKNVPSSNRVDAALGSQFGLYASRHVHQAQAG